MHNSQFANMSIYKVSSASIPLAHEPMAFVRGNRYAMLTLPPKVTGATVLLGSINLTLNNWS